MTKHRLISALIFSAAVASAAAPAPGHSAITPAQIAAAIGAAGMRISADQVALLSDVVATTASPRLKVESMEPWGDHRMRVRLDCEDSEQCLPFFVAVRLNQDDASPAAAADAERSSTETMRGRIDPKSFVVRAGAPATLLLEGAHVHIRVAVVCLENGAPGQTIRVTSKDHRQTYMAKVIGEAVLRASL
ncbi:MAG: hypothetical protein ABR987_24165 [Terracidiphilus sp.]|jgi:hypothetical protein